MQILEEVVKSYKQRLCKVDILCRYDHSQGEGSKYKDADCGKRAYDDGLRIVSGRIVHIHHMDTHHLHTGIEEEDAACKHYVVKILQVREETLRHVHVVRTSCSNIDDAQYYQQACRNDRADHSAPFADLADPVQTFKRDEGRYPVDRKHCHQRIDLVRRKYSVAGIVHSDVCERYGTEGKYGRIPYCRFYPLKPYRKKSGPCAECFSDPSEDSSLLVREHGGKFSRNHSRRYQEDQCRKKIVECRRRSVNSFCRKTSKAYNGC